MKAGNGLNVPQGYGGGGVVLKGALRPQRSATRAAPRGRTLPAEQCEGKTLRGQRTLDAYEVLHVSEPIDGRITLTVRNCRTDEIRHWPRRVGFRMELA